MYAKVQGNFFIVSSVPSTLKPHNIFPTTDTQTVLKTEGVRLKQGRSSLHKSKLKM